MQVYYLQPLPLWQKAVAGLTAGGLGALVGSPADLSLIRMQSDSTLPAEQRRNYKGVGDALLRIIKDDGVGGLFRGAGPTVVRAMSLNMGMLASNDQVRLSLKLEATCNACWKGNSKAHEATKNCNYDYTRDMYSKTLSRAAWEHAYSNDPPHNIAESHTKMQAKEMLEAAGFEKGGQAVVLGGATLAGFVAAAFSLPFDFVKTRIQKMEKGPDGKYPYKGPLDCAVKTFTQEGPLKFYTGQSHYCQMELHSWQHGAASRIGDE